MSEYKQQVARMQATKARAATKHYDHYEKQHATDQRGYCAKCNAIFGTHQGAKRPQEGRDE